MSPGRGLPLALALLLAALTAACAERARDGAGRAPAAPTFARDVAPILHGNCAVCHRPGGAGPFSLLSYPFGRLSERVSRAWMVGGGSMVYGVGLVTLGVWNVEQLPFVMLALGVASAVMFVPSLVMTTDLARPEIRSTALGGFNAAGSLGFVLGPLVGGGVSTLVARSHGWENGYPAAFAVAGAAEILCVLATLPMLRRLRRAGRTT